MMSLTYRGKVRKPILAKLIFLSEHGLLPSCSLEYLLPQLLAASTGLTYEYLALEYYPYFGIQALVLVTHLYLGQDLADRH